MWPRFKDPNKTKQQEGKVHVRSLQLVDEVYSRLVVSYIVAVVMEQDQEPTGNYVRLKFNGKN